LIKNELTLHYKSVIIQEFAKPEWQSNWKDGQNQAPEALKQLLIDAAPLILSSMIANSMQSVLFNFQSQLQNNGRAY
jgi:hypothetical protein